MQDDVATEGEKIGEARRGRTVRRAALALAILGVFLLLFWSTDRVTLQGERTIYTVACAGGTWTGNTCSGRLTVGPRYAFRASPSRREVIYWVRGSNAPSGKYSDCSVTDRDNWSCKAGADVNPRTIATGMAKGRPTRAAEAPVLPFHSVPKWKWWFINAGIGSFRDARD
jgi:hypothetical protein